MKILVVGSSEDSGGGVSSVINIIRQMPVWEEYKCYWLGTQIQAGICIKLWYALKAYLKALFIIWKYDIVHFHTVPDFSVWVQLPVFVLALLGNKKIIMHLHVGNQLGMKMCTKYRLAHWCMQKADVLVLLAHRFCPLLDEYWPEVKTRRVVVYNAIEMPEQAFSVTHEAKRHTILFAGTFNNNKSGDILIKAFAQIVEKFPDWKLQMLGNGPQYNYYKNLVCSLGVEDNVEMPGYISGKEKEKYFKYAGIYVMCSKYEGFPMVVLEAWAHCTPVVTTMVGGLPDILEDGKNALVFDYNDVKQLAEKLEILMGNERLRSYIGENGCMIVEKKFSLKVVNEQLADLYSSLM